MDDVAKPVTAPKADQALEKEALAWMDDPYAHFGMSTTKIHSISPAEAEPVLLVAMNLRLEQRRQQIQVLAKLAEAQGIVAAEPLFPRIDQPTAAA